MDRLLIPLDLSGHYDELVQALEDLQWGPTATLLHVIEEIRGVPDTEMEDFYRSLEDRALPILEGVAERLAAVGLHCDLEVRRGRRAETILQVSVERAAAVILLVSHPARRGPTGIRVGSTSHQVALTAPCSVLLLHRAEEEMAEEVAP